MKNFRKQYRTMSVQETLEHKIGTCIEQAKVMHYLLDKINIKNKMFCCRIYEPDDYGNPEDSRLLYQTAGRERKPDDTVLRRGFLSGNSMHLLITRMINHVKSTI